MSNRLLTITFFAFIFHAFSVYSYSTDSIHQTTDGNYLVAKKCIENADYLCARDLLEKLLNSAIEEEDSLNTAIYNLDLAEIAYQVGDFDQANIHLSSALAIAQANKYLKIIAKSRQKEAHIEWRFGDNLSAIKNISESIQLYKEIKDTSSLLQARAILAGVYMSIKKYDDSEAIYYDLLKVATSTGDTSAIATCYQHLGVLAYYKGDYVRSINFYNSALSLNSLQGDKLHEALNQGNMGEALLAQGNISQANEYLQKSLKTLKELDFNSGIIFVLYTLGRVHHELQHFELAHQYYLESVALMKFIGEVRERNYVYQLISENLASNGNFKDALAYYQQYSAEKDSLFGIEKTRQLEELRAKYLLDESKNENLKLNQQNKKVQDVITAKERLINYQYIITGIIFFSLLIFVSQFYILRKSKQRLEHSNNTKNRLFNIIAHDIKNPVGNIASLVQLLEKTKDEKLELKLLQMLKQSSQSITILVNSILSWSISNNENFQFNYKELNLYELTERVVGLFVYDLSEKNISLQNKVEPSYEVKCDEDIVSTIIRNLLSNAIKFTPPNGTISIWIAVTDRFHEIHVKDNGVGMDDFTKRNILRGNKVSSKLGTSNEKGTGIGFTLINDLIDKLNGKIEINSVINEGTEVIVYLPNHLN